MERFSTGVAPTASVILFDDRRKPIRRDGNFVRSWQQIRSRVIAVAVCVYLSNHTSRQVFDGDSRLRNASAVASEITPKV